MTATTAVDCWRVYGWSRGRWTLRAMYFDADEAAEQAEALHHKLRIRTRVQHVVRRVPAVTPPPSPTVAQLFREQQSDQMVIRRQALAYFKSGSNGTEIPALPTREDTNA